ncbi:M14-type cytosolic carboxypeptidase [Nisaea acidiphila]|uniref:M14-type cytosolic carboxypeptidase n=1 Tax=Nisaea acidiphila TaxID=1862145 RepID=A0A9J7AYS1_9PROT|nr:M14-type cytosolic carboxypeptidase [Nisaea acidiphila]UUX50581.1 M14-type cytosolic carboxypeptidase [Nisaea acidiphila]
MLRIDAAFDSGNIETVSLDDPNDIQLRIRKDNQSDFYQWFHFRLSGAAGRGVTMRILNAGGSSYPKGWENYRVCASYDRETWFRVPTSYDGTELTIRHVPEADYVWYAYFEPYSMERHQDLIASAQLSGRCTAEVIGETYEGQTIDLLTLGEAADGKKALWVFARQHPGEPMAEWYMEGFVERLLDETDGTSRALLEKAVIYAVPNMNPDGTRRGHLRTNALGVNLNREWAEPSEEKSPEVLCVLEEMAARGIDLSFDVHGDEAIPYNFIAGSYGVPGIADAHVTMLDRFQAVYAAINPDFQTEHGYPKPAPGKGNLTTSTGHIANRLGALSMTLEMPFKDADNQPDPVHGWDGARSKALGRSLVDVLLATVDELPARMERN